MHLSSSLLRLIVVTSASAATSRVSNFINHQIYGSAQQVGDEIILTPPGRPSQAGAIWATDSTDLPEWTLDIKFRVNGPPGGGKGLAIWFTADRGQGGQVFGSMDQWDGLGVFLTTQSDGTGVLRGHLNDRSVKYARLEDAASSVFGVDHDHTSAAAKQAFAACTMLYRNLGTISTITLSYNDGSLKVQHDGELCFENEHVRLPKGYYFGVSALSGEVADSFELFGVAVAAVSHTPHRTSPQPNADKPQRAFATTPAAAMHGTQSDSGSGSPAPGHEQALGHVVEQLIRDAAETKDKLDRLIQLASTIQHLEQTISRLDTSVAQVRQAGMTGNQVANGGGADDAHIQTLSRQVHAMEAKFDLMERHIEKQTERIVAALPPPAASAVKWAVAIIVLVQLTFIGSFVLYRRRQENKDKMW
ncbi:hypothetical protein PYCC9005_000554 [Savitreella phatthalungensis]